MNYRLGVLVAALATAMSSSVVNASTITDSFAFYDNSTVVATGSFSYDSSNSGLLTFSELTAFTISGQSQTYGLSDVQGSLNSYNYFGFDTNLRTFVPAAVNGYLGAVDGIFAAVDNGGHNGFFFDPLPGQSDPLSNGGNDGAYAFYQNCGYCAAGPFPTFTSFTVSAIPEPSTWVMMILGFAGLGTMAYRRKAKPEFMAA